MSIYDYHVLKSLGLSDASILHLLPRLVSKTFAADQVLWPKGASDHPWCHILNGLVGASQPGADGEHAPLDIYGVGSWFGEATLFKHTPSALEYVSLTEVRVMMLTSEDAQQAFKTAPQLAQHVAELVAWRSQRHSEMLALGRTGNPTMRVVLGMAIFAESMQKGAAHLPVSSKDHLEVPLKQSLIAAICGVSRGVFSEQIQPLVAAGWLRVNYATITLLRLSGWSNFSRMQREKRVIDSKPTLADILRLLEQAAASR